MAKKRLVVNYHLPPELKTLAENALRKGVRHARRVHATRVKMGLPPIFQEIVIRK